MQERPLSHSISSSDRIAILGASRGLGFAFYQELLKIQPEAHYLLSSRKISDIKSRVTDNSLLIPQDFSRMPVQNPFLNSLKEFAPTRLIYMAGGGPFGDFATKKWGDHQWAITTTFLYPAELLHHILSQSHTWPFLRQIVFIGSQIAEGHPDRGAASYAAAKHALRGLITTIQTEHSLGPEVILFSPGYMQTDLLPKNSWPVTQGMAADPEIIARKLIDLIEKNNQR